MSIFNRMIGYAFQKIGLLRLKESGLLPNTKTDARKADLALRVLEFIEKGKPYEAWELLSEEESKRYFDGRYDPVLGLLNGRACHEGFLSGIGNDLLRHHWQGDRTLAFLAAGTSISEMQTALLKQGVNLLEEKEAKKVYMNLYVMRQYATYFGLEPYEHVTAWVALSDASALAGCMDALPSHGAPRQRQLEPALRPAPVEQPLARQVDRRCGRRYRQAPQWRVVLKKFMPLLADVAPEVIALVHRLAAQLGARSLYPQLGPGETYI